jgi:phospholipid transport system substrate-binding protein
MYCTLRTLSLTLVFAGLFAPAPSQAATKSSIKKVKKPISIFVNAVRYGKNSVALKYVDGDAQGAFLVGDGWTSKTPAEKSQFIKLFHVLFSELAFPKLKDNLQKIETILYGDVKEMDGYTQLSSTLVVLHALKKQEVKVYYRLSKKRGKYRLVDVTFAGDASLLTHVRDDQIQPLLKEGGWDGLIKQLQTRAAEIEAKHKG